MNNQTKTFLILTFWVNACFAQINTEKDSSYTFEYLTNAAKLFAPKSDTVITYGRECGNSNKFEKIVLANNKGLWKMYTYSEKWKFHKKKEKWVIKKTRTHKVEISSFDISILVKYYSDIGLWELNNDSLNLCIDSSGISILSLHGCGDRFELITQGSVIIKKADSIESCQNLIFTRQRQTFIDCYEKLNKKTHHNTGS